MNSMKNTILYIDDEESNLRGFKNLFRRKFNVLITSNGKEGISLFDENEVDLVISDQRMNEMSGLDFLSIIKQKKPLVPTILLTGYSDYEVLKKAFNEVGIHKYINKPFDPENLAIIMELAIETYCLHKNEAKHKVELLKSEEQFRLISEESPFHILKLNRDLKVEYANKPALKLRLESKSQLDEVLFEDFFKKENCSTVANAIKGVFENGGQFNLEIKSQTSETEIRWFNINISYLYAGEFESVLLMIFDISERKKMELVLRNINEQLESKVKERTRDLETAKINLEIAYKQEKELSQLKSKFVSTASHQFRTPLTVIQSNMGLLEMQIDQASDEFKSKFKRIYNRIQTEIIRMTDIMDNVLILGKKESGVIIPNFQMVDILSLSKSIVEKYNQIQEDGRKIEVEFTGSPSLYHVDPELFENAFSNLVSNAFKYSLSKPPPIVRLEYKKSGLTIIVQDFGIGIPENEKSNIFEPFYRASNARDISGTGLGTSIVKAYLEIMGATIDIESKLGEFTKCIIKIKK